ncbi:type I-E CRISPR-associated protein Cse1/CasA [Streptomyces anulatus]|uniref:type I-E CRISPR-associated protein Cse1/CasA n=1 Tax=Streptomyces anulatus TaxID=1892 RepID=UPI00403E0EA3
MARPRPRPRRAGRGGAVRCASATTGGAYRTSSEPWYCENRQGICPCCSQWLSPRPPTPRAQAAARTPRARAHARPAHVRKQVPGTGSTQDAYFCTEPAPAPACIVTHLHVEAHTLKDLLLALPPQPRAPGDAPVWEQVQPPTAMRTRAPRGRLDWLTWSTRRVRLCPRPRRVEAWTASRCTTATASRCRCRCRCWIWPRHTTPMTAWSTPVNGCGRTLMRFTDDDLGLLKPWQPLGSSNPPPTDRTPAPPCGMPSRPPSEASSARTPDCPPTSCASGRR